MGCFSRRMGHSTRYDLSRASDTVQEISRCINISFWITSCVTRYFKYKIKFQREKKISERAYVRIFGLFRRNRKRNDTFGWNVQSFWPIRTKIGSYFRKWVIEWGRARIKSAEWRAMTYPVRIRPHRQSFWIWFQVGFALSMEIACYTELFDRSAYKLKPIMQRVSRVS